MQSWLTCIRILTPPLISFHRGHSVIDHWCSSQTTKCEASSATFTAPLSYHLAISSTISFNTPVVFPPHTRSPFPMFTTQYRFRLPLSSTQISLYKAFTPRIRAMGTNVLIHVFNEISRNDTGSPCNAFQESRRNVEALVGWRREGR